jgi:porin
MVSTGSFAVLDCAMADRVLSGGSACKGPILLETRMSYPVTTFVAAAASLALALFPPLSVRAEEEGKKEDKLQESITTALPIFSQIAEYREGLFKNGVQYSFTYVSDLQSNISGGARRGTVYEGRLETKLDIDLEKFADWQGGKVHFNAFAINGRGLSRYYVKNIMTTSEIEALSTVRLSEAWYEHQFGERLAVKIGQLAADVEFHTRNFEGAFVNGTFGWPAIAAANLPSGGPAYPFATPGVRVVIRPAGNDDLLFRAAVFNGDPAGPGANDPQERNRFGVNFRLRDPPLIIGEAEFRYGNVKDQWLLPGTIKLGVWNHLGRFDDLRLSVEGISTADPSSSGIPLRRRGNDGIYAVAEQMIYHVPDAEKDKGAAVFVRVSGSPADRSLVNFYIDGGLNLNGIIPGRADDLISIGGAYTHISPNATLLDQEKVFFSGVPTPIRRYEALFEMSYQAQIMTGWTLQPDFQYIFRPGGGISNPNDPTGIQSIHNAAVVGLRSMIKF